MSDFVNYVCWSDAGVLASAPRDAGSLKAGHFRAVHHPLRAKRGRLELGHGADGVLVDEQEVTDALRSAIGPDGYLLIPVVGGSGTGKSHLVRWVYEQTRDTPGWETRYLAKNRTSIRRVVELVLEGMSGPVIDAAREALESAPAHSENEETLGQRLLDELALVVAEEPVFQSDADRRSAEMREKLRRELPDVLRDPVVRRRLMSADAVIPRLIGLARSGRRDDDGLDDAARVLESDLPLTFDDISHASRGARKALLGLGNLPELRRAALEIINDALPRAVKRVFLSNSIDLIAVFRDIRRELRDQGRELVLFVEDLTVLHGVEREFLDAIVEPASSPDGDLCRLRVLFAITRGHFDSLDTVRTRCSDAYWLDSTYGTDGVDLEEALSFLGRYLNACRLDPQQMEREWGGRTNGTWPANACDACGHHDTCHESFGASNEGYGLYPLNRTAIDRMISSLSPQRFDPRQVVKAIIEKFLPLSKAELESASFPSRELMGDFNSSSTPVRPEVVHKLQREHGSEWERLDTLLRYWSEDREKIAGSTSTVFGLRPLGRHTAGVDKRRTPVDRNETRQDRTSPRAAISEIVGIRTRLKPDQLRAFDQLQSWVGQGHDLTLPVTNFLKTLIHRAVAEALDMSESPFNLGSGLLDEYFKRDSHIYLEGTQRSQADPADAIIRVQRDTETAVALAGLIVHQATAQSHDPDDDQHRRALARYLEEWTRDVASALSQIASTEAPTAVEGLLIASLVCGDCEGAQQSHDYLSHMFRKPDTGLSAPNSTEWQSAVDQAEEVYSRMRRKVETHLGESRGKTGGIRALRTDRMLPYVDEVLARLNSGDLSSADASTDRFLRKVDRAIEKEWTLLCDQARAAAPLLESDQSLDHQVDRIKELAEVAIRAGRFSGLGSMTDIETASGNLPTGTLSALRDVADAESREYTLTQRIQLLSGATPRKVAAASEFVKQATAMMNAIEADLDARAPSSNAADQLALTVSSIEQELSKLLDAAQRVVQ